MSRCIDRVAGPAVISLVIALSSFGANQCVFAQSFPRSWEASPDIYRVIAENEKNLVVEVVWKPGQRDKMHVHREAAVYNLTDCWLRAYLPDGTSGEGFGPAQIARLQAAVPGHSIENVGKANCRLIMFEAK
jgi:beta-alanine degradation protein BauB